VYAIYKWYGNQQYPENNLAQPVVVVEDADLYIHTSGADGRNTKTDGITYFNNTPLVKFADIPRSTGDGGPKQQAAVLHWFEPVQEKHEVLAYTTAPAGQSSGGGMVYARLGTFYPYGQTNNGAVNAEIEFSLISSQTHTGTFIYREDYKIYITQNNTGWGENYSSITKVGGSDANSLNVDSMYLVKSGGGANVDIWVSYYSHYRSQPIAVVTDFNSLTTKDPNGHSLNWPQFKSARYEPALQSDMSLKRAYGGDTILTRVPLTLPGYYAGTDKENTFTKKNVFADTVNILYNKSAWVETTGDAMIGRNLTVAGNTYLGNEGTDTIFANAPILMAEGYTPTNPQHVATKGYVDGLAQAKKRRGDKVDVPSYLIATKAYADSVMGNRTVDWADIQNKPFEMWATA
jgi:hypothetical protein